MALTFATQSEVELSLGSFLARVEETLDVDNDEETLEELAEALAALAKNRTFLTDFLKTTLSDIASFQEGNPYAAQVLTRTDGVRPIVKPRAATSCPFQSPADRR